MGVGSARGVGLISAYWPTLDDSVRSIFAESCKQ